MTAEIRLSEKYQVMPSMPPEQFAALKADIAERGVLTPIDIDEEGHILDGHHRYRACLELEIADFPTIVRPGLSEEDRLFFARKANMLRRHLSRNQVQHLVAEQLKDTPAWANNRIGNVLGVDSKTVSAMRERLERTSEIPKLDRLVGADGKERPIKSKRPPAVMAANAADLSRILARLSQLKTPTEIEGFLSEQGFAAFTITTTDYNPFAHCDADGIRQWHLFVLFGIAPEHVEWLLQRQFKTPDEWLGEEGLKFRRACRMREPTPVFHKKWGAFQAEHRDKSADQIVALIHAAIDNSAPVAGAAQ